MIKKTLIAAAITLAFVSCNRSFEKAMKSNDAQFVLKTADELYAKKKWRYATDLYTKIAPDYVGTKEAEHIYLNSAYANFYDGNETLAAKQFENFFVQYRRSPKAEEALYMSAYSYYKGSPAYNLDQKNTYEAMKALQNFIDTYPTSSRVKEANELINELRRKLEKKAFNIAKDYYRTLKYKAAAVNFGNFIDDFPDSKYREEAYIYLLRSKAELAIHSVLSKKENRLKEARTAYRLLKRNYPNSQYLDEAEKWLKKIEEEEVETIKELKRIEEYNKNRKKLIENTK
ncbi:outer membrane protein assembly factor BamD [Ornithobacterium rhinotracheale]|uniref:outer membrane protein assembly factor BamD n=1 Tax=Ornithobacterium rhinotracheale TaxID=28251 RepID=UPI004036A846